MARWVDKKTYWAMVYTEDERLGKKVVHIPQVPSIKKLDYVTLYQGTPIEMNLCIGVWDDEVYTPINQEELSFHRSKQ